MTRSDCGCRSHNGFLTAKGLEEAAQRSDFRRVVDAMGNSYYVDKVDSVSGLELERDLHVFDDSLLDSQYRRFLNGS